jgi:hypothetical protein
MEYMISTFNDIYSYFRIFMCFVAFTYFYKHFFDICIVEKECVFVSKKTNKKKIKKVEMPKRLLSFIYFILISLLYYYMNFNVFICFTSILVIFILRMCQKFDESLIDILYVLDNNIIIKSLYFSFYWICKSLFFIFKPFYKRLESKKNNNFDSVKNLFIKRLGNTEYGNLLPILGFSNDKKNNDEKNNDEGIGNIMNIFGDLGDLHKLFEDTKSSSKSSSSTDDSHSNKKISDPKWLKRSTQSSTDNLDKYMLSNIVSNKDFNKITNLNNNKIIEINDNHEKKNSKNQEKKNSKNHEKKNSKNHEKKNSKNHEKKNEEKSEDLVNLYKKMNDVFSSIQLNKKK